MLVPSCFGDATFIEKLIKLMLNYLYTLDNFALLLILQPEPAVDMKQRFVGHCNIGTDIKQASFLGQRGMLFLMWFSKLEIVVNNESFSYIKQI